MHCAFVCVQADRPRFWEERDRPLLLQLEDPGDFFLHLGLQTVNHLGQFGFGSLKLERIYFNYDFFKLCYHQIEIEVATPPVREEYFLDLGQHKVLVHDVHRCGETLLLGFDNLHVQARDHHFGQLDLLLLQLLNVMIEHVDIAWFAFDVGEAESQDYHSAEVVHGREVDLEEAVLVLPFAGAGDQKHFWIATSTLNHI